MKIRHFETLKSDESSFPDASPTPVEAAFPPPVVPALPLPYEGINSSLPEETVMTSFEADALQDSVDVFRTHPQHHSFLLDL